MKDRRDIAEIGGRVVQSAVGGASSHEQSSGAGGRRWLGVFFRCCHSYGRLYKNDSGSRYEGHCPRCCAKLEVPIGSGGTSRRFFEAS
ncbi:MAG: hypothetical protein KDA16_02915 [Phycisphaerales bacterium]|nr:hypothetical protein [Phycisphaerales bacterium]